MSYKSLYFVSTPLRLENGRTFSQNQFCKVRIAGLIDICVLSTWASHAHGACVSLQSHSPFAPSLQTFPIRERVRVHPRVYVCIIYGDTKDKFWDCLIWKQNIQAKKVSSRHKLVISFKGMGERSIYIFKSCHRSTIRNVQGIMMSRALFDLIPVMRVSCLHTSCLVDFC